MLKEAKQYALPKDHAKVNDDKDHFNVSDANHGRNAISRVNQYSSAPPWFEGTLKELINTVYKNVHSKFPGIDIDPKKKKPGKQSSENLSITKIAKMYEEELTGKEDVEEETTKKTPAQKAKKLKKKMKKMYKKAKKMLKKACKV